MRTMGALLGLALFAGVTAFTLHRQAEGPAGPLRVAAAAEDGIPVTSAAPATTPVPATAHAAEAPRTTAPEAGEAPPSVQEVQEAPPRPTSERRRRWQRNRYPGPIPTPAEWRAPEGPVRIGLQAGHWRADEAPRELEGLKDNGTSAYGTREWEANLAIVREAAERLRALGYEVDVLPAVVPPDYRAHLFIAVHADGAADPAASGFRVASPRRDATGRATAFAELLRREYRAATGIRGLPDATRRMRNYYAFNYRRYEHALHPMTIGVILETGFLTSRADRRVIVDAPARAAEGIVEAVKAYPITSLDAVAEAAQQQAPEGARPRG